MGGSDQWGNITAGIELIRKLRGNQAYGIVFPLITDSTGQKLGKSSEGDNVWLDPAKTSPYKFYQHWINVPDADAIRFLKMFTFLPLDEIRGLEEEMKGAPERRIPQMKLAEELTRLVHDEDGFQSALRASKIMFGGKVTGVDENTLMEIFADVPSFTFPLARIDEGLSIIDLLAESGATKGRGAARRLVDGGGIYLNNVRVESNDKRIGKEDFVAGCSVVVRQGKKNYRLIRFE